MNDNHDNLLEIPELLKLEAREFRNQTQRYLCGEIDLQQYRPYAASMGVYEQRSSGLFMTRIRIGAGMVSPAQLRKISALSSKYTNSAVHATTRQNLQLHGLKLQDVSDVMDELLEVGLATRGGGGNTVRNVTACSRAGVCPFEKFNVAPYPNAVAEYLLQKSESFNLPRKFKIAFSGCSEDCAYALVTDVGFVAKTKKLRKGFCVYAAGGLGSNPATAEKIEDFIPVEDVFEVAEALRRLFAQYGDRTNRNKARLRYVIGRIGREKFIEEYRRYRDDVRRDGDEQDTAADIRLENRDAASSSYNAPVKEIPDLPHFILPEKRTGYHTVVLSPKSGDIPAGDLEAIADIAERFSQGPVRITQLQAVMLTSVKSEYLEEVISRLKLLSTSVLDLSRTKIVSCTGAATCRLGLCDSKALADKIALSLNGNARNCPPIRISGCPNSCGHHLLAKLGFQGRKIKTDTGMKEIYDIFVNADITESQTRLAEKIGSLWPDSIPKFVNRIATEKISQAADIKKLLAHLMQ